MTKLTSTEITRAVTRYARRHGHFVRTVRTMTTLRTCAIHEWREPGSRWVVGRDGEGRPTLPERAS